MHVLQRAASQEQVAGVQRYPQLGLRLLNGAFEVVDLRRWRAAVQLERVGVAVLGL